MSYRQLLKTELGSFFTEYLQNQLLTKGMVILRDKIRFYEGAPKSQLTNTPPPSQECLILLVEQRCEWEFEIKWEL